MRVQLLCWSMAVLLVGVATPRPASAAPQSAYAADRDEDDIDEDEEAAAKKKKRKEKEDEERRRREAERRRSRDDDDTRDEGDDRDRRRSRDDDRGDRRRPRDDDDRGDRRRSRDDDDRGDRRRSRDDDDRGERRRPRDDDRRDEDDRGRRRSRDDDRDDDDRRDDRYDDVPRYRRHRAGDRGPAFRWGISVGPAVAVGNGGGDLAATGGLNLVVARLGYQFPQMDSVALGIFAEPRIGAFISRPFDSTVVAMQLAATFGLQLNIGKYFFFATGLSVGGNLTTGLGDLVRGPVSGGFLLRVGMDLLLHKRFGRPSALSLAIEALPMFAHVSTAFGADGTASFATIGFSVGFESY